MECILKKKSLIRVYLNQGKYLIIFFKKFRCQTLEELKIKKNELLKMYYDETIFKKIYHFIFEAISYDRQT